MIGKIRCGWWLGLSLVVACGSEPGTGEGAAALTEGSASAEEFPVVDAGEPEKPETELEEPDCPRGSSTGPIRVAFACDEVTVITCKDLSNIVLELDDGKHHKVDGLTGHRNHFEAPEDRAIVGVWVKAGANLSGDGPGYGERFLSPTDACDAENEPPTAEDPPAEEPPAAPDDHVDLE